jgi:hypothetical protein
MTRASWTRWTRLTTGAALALLVAGFLAPTPARASCGDYIDMSGSHAAMTGASPERMPGHDLPQAPPRPCSGPHCSKAPFTPAPTPVSAPDRDERWGLGLVLPFLGDVDSGLLPSANDPAQPVHHPARIYHPPR